MASDPPVVVCRVCRAEIAVDLAKLTYEATYATLPCTACSALVPVYVERQDRPMP